MKKDREKIWSIEPGNTSADLIVDEALLEGSSCTFSVYTKLPRQENSFFLPLPKLESGMVFSIAPTPELVWEFTGFDYGILCVTVRDGNFGGKALLPAGSSRLPRRSFRQVKSFTGRSLCTMHCAYRL